MNAFCGYRFNTKKEDLNSDRSAILITNYIKHERYNTFRYCSVISEYN